MELILELLFFLALVEVQCQFFDALLLRFLRLKVIFMILVNWNWERIQ